MEKTRILPIIFFIIAVFNLGANFILIPLYGIMAAALATSLSYVMLTFIVGYFSCKYLKVQVDFKFVLKACLSSSLMLVTLNLMKPLNLPGLIGAVFLGLITYLLSMLVSGGISTGKKVWDFEFFN